MRGFIGCDTSDLVPGDVIVCGDKRMVVIGPATEDAARASAEALGIGPLVVVPGERFYEVETTVLIPAAANN
jgi:hypothetical protein